METPNLSYIHSLSGGDKEFEQELLSVLKEEFPIEKQVYQKSIEEKKYKNAAENVHKLKHKISILGLEKSYQTANTYENQLKEDNLSLQNEFDAILTIITNYLETP